MAGYQIIPLFHPWRIVFVVICAGNEFTAAFGKPESLSNVAARQDRTAVLDRDAECAGSAAIVNHQFIRRSGGEQVARRNSLVGFRLSSDILSIVKTASALCRFSAKITLELYRSKKLKKYYQIYRCVIDA